MKKKGRWKFHLSFPWCCWDEIYFTINQRIILSRAFSLIKRSLSCFFLIMKALWFFQPFNFFTAFADPSRAVTGSKAFHDASTAGIKIFFVIWNAVLTGYFIRNNEVIFPILVFIPRLSHFPIQSNRLLKVHWTNFLLAESSFSTLLMNNLPSNAPKIFLYNFLNLFQSVHRDKSRWGLTRHN